jgi:MFS family permease
MRTDTGWRKLAGLSTWRRGSTTKPLSDRAVLVTIALATMLAPLNSTMIAVALPELLADFNRSLAWGSWIVTSYLVAMAAIQPLGGSLGDRYGRRGGSF